MRALHARFQEVEGSPLGQRAVRLREQAEAIMGAWQKELDALGDPRQISAYFSGPREPLAPCFRKSRCEDFAACAVKEQLGGELAMRGESWSFSSGWKAGGLYLDTMGPGGAHARPASFGPAGSDPGVPSGAAPGVPVVTAPGASDGGATGADGGGEPQAGDAHDQGGPGPDLSSDDPRWVHGPDGRAAKEPPRAVMALDQRLILVESRAGKARTLLAADLGPFLARGESSERELLRAPKGQILLRTGHSLLALGREGMLRRVWKSRPGHRVAAAAMHGERFLLATEGSLVVLDSRFKELGRVHLEMRHSKKEVHHILVRGDDALLLDNKLLPALLFRVDLSDPRRPQVLQTVNLFRTWIRLEHQWVDVRSGRWLVVVSSSHRCGETQAVAMLSLARPDPKAMATMSSQRTYNPFPSLGDDRWVLASPTIWQRQRQAPPCGELLPRRPPSGKAPAAPIPRRKKARRHQPDIDDQVSGDRILALAPGRPNLALTKADDKIYISKLRVRDWKVQVIRALACQVSHKARFGRLETWLALAEGDRLSYYRVSPTGVAPHGHPLVVRSTHLQGSVRDIMLLP
ncbi:MAG: hypothetical protein RBU30_09270 [Polyangia bacterium]|nr:hypothetical protein [Polyangia bacterium]